MSNIPGSYSLVIKTAPLMLFLLFLSFVKFVASLPAAANITVASTGVTKVVSAPNTTRVNGNAAEFILTGRCRRSNSSGHPIPVSLLHLHRHRWSHHHHRFLGCFLAISGSLAFFVASNLFCIALHLPPSIVYGNKSITSEPTRSLIFTARGGSKSKSVLKRFSAIMRFSGHERMVERLTVGNGSVIKLFEPEEGSLPVPSSYMPLSLPSACSSAARGTSLRTRPHRPNSASSALHCPYGLPH